MCTESHRFTLPVRSCYSLIPDWHHDLIAQPSQRIVSLPSFFEHQNSGLRLSEEPEGCGTKSICLLRACQELDDYETGRKWITAAPSRERKSAGALLQSAVADWHDGPIQRLRRSRYAGFSGGAVLLAAAAGGDDVGGVLRLPACVSHSVIGPGRRDPQLLASSLHDNAASINNGP